MKSLVSYSFCFFVSVVVCVPVALYCSTQAGTLRKIKPCKDFQYTLAAEKFLESIGIQEEMQELRHELDDLNKSLRLINNEIALVNEAITALANNEIAGNKGDVTKECLRALHLEECLRVLRPKKNDLVDEVNSLSAILTGLSYKA